MAIRIIDNYGRTLAFIMPKKGGGTPPVKIGGYGNSWDQSYGISQYSSSSDDKAIA